VEASRGIHHILAGIPMMFPNKTHPRRNWITIPSPYIQWQIPSDTQTIAWTKTTHVKEAKEQIISKEIMT
jgi:hypothetical protein